jgi:hypothetical protein
MSVKCLTAVFYEVQNCSPAEKMVLLAIADHARDSGQTWPGIDLIAKKASVTHRAVTDILIRLEEKGQLIIDRNWGPKSVNWYSLTCVAKGKYNPPTRQEMVDEGEERASLHRNAVPTPAPSSYPPKTLGNEAPPRNAVPTQERRSLGTPDARTSYEPLGTFPPSPPVPDVAGAGEGMDRMPGLEEVLIFSRSYPGNDTKKIPPGMPDDWAQGFFDWRTFTEEFWPRRWREEMQSRFERDWVNGHPRARGIKPDYAALVASVGVKPAGNGVWAVKQQLVMLKNRAASHPANEASSAYCGDPDEAATREFEQILSAIRECERKLEGGTGVIKK